MSVDLGQISLEKPDYIVIKMDYQTKLILPLQEGFNFLHMWSGGIEVVTSYNKPTILQRMERTIEISFMTAAALKEMQLSCLLDPPS